jgi:hypothetical protein
MLSVEIWDRTRGVYRKLTMKRELVATKLETRHLCKCGYGFVKDDVPEGKVYVADVGTLRWGDFLCGGCGRAQKNIPIVNVLDEEAGQFYPFALDVLELRHQVRMPVDKNVTIH